MWSAPQYTFGTSPGRRVSVASWGKRFLIGALGGDSRAYVAIQQMSGGALAWVGYEQAWVDPNLLLIEPPTLVLFQGATFLLGRDQGQRLRYWIRNPNVIEARYAPAEMWLGGGIVGGTGIGATPPALASVSGSMVSGIGGAAELYVGARGIGDKQVYALNLTRFAAIDLLSAGFGITFQAPPWAPALDPRTFQNLFEHLFGVLALPTKAWATIFYNRACGGSAGFMRIKADTELVGQAHPLDCPPFLYLNASDQSAFYLMHEWMHADWQYRHLAQSPGLAATFPDPSPKLCQNDGDCGGATCRLNDADFGWFEDPTIRRWIGQKVCMEGDRVQGFITTYAIHSAEHDMVETAQRYRFLSDPLHQACVEDLARGNSSLWNKYLWLRSNYFDGIEYTGIHSTFAVPRDRSEGTWGFPSR